MKQISFEQYNKYVSIIFLVIIIILSYFIIKSFVTAILSSVVLAYLCSPLYRIINKRLKNPTLTASIIIIVLIIIVAIPSFFIVNSLIKDAIELNNFIKVSGAYSKLQEIKYLPQIINKATEYIISNASHYIVTLPGKILNLFVMFFTLFYLLTEGGSLLKNIIDRIPLEEHQRKHLIDKFVETVHALVFGLLVTGIIQGIIITISFYIFNVKSPILFGFLVVLFAILPAIGASAVWIPAGLIKILTGSFVDGIGILLIGAILVTPVELLLKPKLIGKKSSLHPLAILLGVLGGVQLMGFIGIIYGPLILLTAITLIKFIEETKNIKLTV